MIWSALLACVLLGMIQWAGPVLDRLSTVSKERFSSFVGGVSLSYVILYLLYELIVSGSTELHTLIPLGHDPLETVFVLLLGTLVVGYLLHARVSASDETRDDHQISALFFVLYGLFAGGALVEEARWGLLNLALYVVAVALHLMFNERFLYHLSPPSHTPRWRLTLAGAPSVGGLLSLGLGAPPGFAYLLLVMVAGLTIISVIRLELPEPSALRPVPFLGGVIGYALLIAANWRF